MDNFAFRDFRNSFSGFQEQFFGVSGTHLFGFQLVFMLFLRVIKRPIILIIYIIGWRGTAFPLSSELSLLATSTPLWRTSPSPVSLRSRRPLPKGNQKKRLTSLYARKPLKSPVFDFLMAGRILSYTVIKNSIVSV